MESLFINKYNSYAKRKCIICKKEYVINTNNQKCCSKECSHINKLQYNNSDAMKEHRRQYQKTDRFKQLQSSEKYKKIQKKLKQNPKYKEEQKKYWKTERGKLAKKRYEQSELGKISRIGGHIKRRAVKMNVIETFYIEEFQQKVKKCNGICPCCNKPFDNYLHLLTMDHIYALTKAYQDFLQTGIKRIYTIDDVQPLCLSCNIRKKDRINKKLNPKDLYNIIYNKNQPTTK